MDSEVLGVEVDVAKVEISTFRGKGSISGLTITNSADYESPHAITIDDLSVHVDPGSMGSDKMHIKEIIIDDVSLSYEKIFWIATSNSYKNLRKPVPGV
ncbi:MAG: hypothetical protein P8J55_02085 [Pseudomonadales bacterium]|nr:hypothetical protein [Pseudomonadales bacterium]